MIREMLLVGGQGVRTMVVGSWPSAARHGVAQVEVIDRLTQNRLVGIVRAITQSTEGARVEIRLLDGQCLALSTSRSAVEWLQLSPGKQATVAIDESDALLTRNGIQQDATIPCTSLRPGRLIAE